MIKRTKETFQEVMLGKVFISVTLNNNDDEIHFVREDGRKFVFYHDQNCCESVYIEDVIGSLSDLEGSPITQAEEETSTEDCSADAMWTFYKFATAKGYVTVRWLGESEYYSVSVDFGEITD